MRPFLPKYPVYVPSKGRHDSGFTVKALLTDEVPFHLVVEPSEADAYAAAFPTADLLVLPEDGMRLLGSRLWIRDHATRAGHARHWQVDDNIRQFFYRHRAVRVPCEAGIALHAVEEFTDRYTNIGIAGLNYDMFLPDGYQAPPFYLNCHVYSCSLIDNAMPYTWRLYYNDDTDLCLQVLTGGLCTVAFNAFLQKKIVTMAVNGGNTDDLYRADGRLKMARTLERQWPGVVVTSRKFGRPQHHIVGNWSQFTQPLIRRDDLDWEAIASTPPAYSLHLKQVKDEVQSPRIREWLGAS